MEKVRPVRPPPRAPASPGRSVAAARGSPSLPSPNPRSRGPTTAWHSRERAASEPPAPRSPLSPAGNGASHGVPRRPRGSARRVRKPPPAPPAAWSLRNAGQRRDTEPPGAETPQWLRRLPGGPRRGRGARSLLPLAGVFPAHRPRPLRSKRAFHSASSYLTNVEKREGGRPRSPTRVPAGPLPPGSPRGHMAAPWRARSCPRSHRGEGPQGLGGASGGQRRPRRGSRDTREIQIHGATGFRPPHSLLHQSRPSQVHLPARVSSANLSSPPGLSRSLLCLSVSISLSFVSLYFCLSVSLCLYLSIFCLYFCLSVSLFLISASIFLSLLFSFSLSLSVSLCSLSLSVFCLCSPYLSVLSLSLFWAWAPPPLHPTCCSSLSLLSLPGPGLFPSSACRRPVSCTPPRPPSFLVPHLLHLSASSICWSSRDPLSVPRPCSRSDMVWLWVPTQISR
nr:translation initiation factor IF-2-like [Gorilla gorilla gorilla]